MASRNGNANQLNRSGNNISTNNPGLQPNSIRTGAYPNAIPLSTSYLQTPMSSGYAPHLPGRRISPNSYGSRMGMGMGSYYNPYSRYPTNMYSPGFGGYRSYGGYGGMGGGESTSSFIQMAEESTRPAFESIESVVEVVSSISMMLESTYHAVHSSYSAILGVVDQFSRLKDHLAQMLSIMALLRGLRWLCLKVLYLLKLRKDNPSDESAWGAAAEAAASGLSSLPPLPEKDRGSAWPFLMFVGLVIGAPWLMFKLLSKTVKKNPLDTRVFRDDQGHLLVATTAYEFKATQRDELSFSAGEKLYISPKSSRTSSNGWLFACNQKLETGLVPSTYLRHKANNSPQNNQRNQIVQVLGKRVSGPLPVNQVPGAVCGNQVSGSQPFHQVPGWQLDNQVPSADSGAQPINQVPVLQPDNRVSGSQMPWESYEDLINGAQDFNEVFGQPRNLVDNPNHQPNHSYLPKNSGYQPNNISSGSQMDSGNHSDNFNKIVTGPSTADNLKNSSERINDDKTPQEVSNNKPTDTRYFQGEWQDTKGNIFMVTAAYDFKATKKGELSFSAGEKLYIFPKCIITSPNGWLFASNQRNETGHIPSTYLRRKAKKGPQKNKSKQIVQVLGKRVSGPLPVNQVPSAVCGNQVSGTQQFNQVTGWQLDNQVPSADSGAQPVNQVPVLQPDNRVSGSQPAWESYEDLVNRAQDFNKVFGQPNNLIDNPNHQPNDSDLPKNSGCQPNNISSGYPSGSQMDSGNHSENINKVVTDPSSSDTLKNSSEGINDNKDTPRSIK